MLCLLNLRSPCQARWCGLGRAGQRCAEKQPSLSSRDALRLAHPFSAEQRGHAAREWRANRFRREQRASNAPCVTRPMQNLFLTNLLAGRRCKDVRRIGQERWGEKCHYGYLCFRHWRDAALAGSSPVAIVALAAHDASSRQRFLKS